MGKALATSRCGISFGSSQFGHLLKRSLCQVHLNEGGWMRVCRYVVITIFIACLIDLTYSVYYPTSNEPEPIEIVSSVYRVYV